MGLINKFIKFVYYYVVVQELLSSGLCTGQRFNAALLKSTNQSSTYTSETLSKNAVDGSRDNDAERLCTHTRVQQHNWWSVDLGRIYRVLSVIITNRHQYSDRLEHFSIIGANESYNVLQQQNFHQCHQLQNYHQKERTVDYQCKPQPMDVQFVIINQTGASVKILTLCEVEVIAECPNGIYGEKCVSCNSTGFCKNITSVPVPTTVQQTTTTSTTTTTSSPQAMTSSYSYTTDTITDTTPTSKYNTNITPGESTWDPRSLEDPTGNPVVPALVGSSVAVMVIMIIIIVIIFKRRYTCTLTAKINRQGEETDMTKEISIAEYVNVQKSLVVVNPVGFEDVVNEVELEINNESAYANAPGCTEVNTCDIASYVMRMKTQNEPYKYEYESLPNAVYPWDESETDELKTKNRYRNIYPYNYNRVKLQQVGNNPLSTYINASFVKDHKEDVSYIAALGCTKFTLDDAWRMIWEHNIQLVVMVTKLVEDMKVNCRQYWPSEGSLPYGEITVSLKEENIYPYFTERTFQISKRLNSRTVTHYQYTAWPDKSVPEHLPSLCKIREVMKTHRQNGQTPILVHCSTGVGRTGTIIALDILLDQVETEDKVDIYRCVDILRTQRTNLVQTLVQYIFLHDALNEILTVGSTMISRDQLHSVLIRGDNQDLSKQFEFLQSIAPCFSDSDMELGKFQNKDFNRDINIIPADSLRVKLLSSPEMYINAVYVQGFHKEIGHIATQIPMPNTVGLFWQMVYEQNCTSIVCLQNDSKYTSWFSKHKTSVMFDDLAVITTHVESKDIMTKYDITVGKVVEKEYANVVSPETENQSKDSINLRIFLLKDCLSKSLNDRDIASFLEGIREIHNNEGSGLSTVICRNGSNECGLYIALSWLLQMADIKQEVDVFHVVKLIRKIRPQFISDMEQYLFLHKAVQMYVNRQHSQADE